MKGSKPSPEKALSALRAWYLVGILGFSFSFTFSWFRYLTPLSLILLAALYWLYHPHRDRKFYGILGLIFLAGFLVEAAGVQTGKIFGVYSYGSILGPKLAATPVIIGLNWVIMVYGALAISTRLSGRRSIAALLAALFMTGSDVIIERFAILSGMWSWEAGTPPLQNYLAWFFISLVLALLGNWLGLASRKNKVAAPLFFIQLLFFIAIDIWIIIERIWVSS